MIGTEGYSPPEQYRGKVETRSDIYALGATMHHALSGRDPTTVTRRQGLRIGAFLGGMAGLKGQRSFYDAGLKLIDAALALAAPAAPRAADQADACLTRQHEDGPSAPPCPLQSARCLSLMKNLDLLIL